MAAAVAGRNTRFRIRRARRVIHSGLLLSLCSHAAFLSCAGRPDWVLRLPDRAGVAASVRESLTPAMVGDAARSNDAGELAGLWVRETNSRYGAGNARAHSVGSEKLRIESVQTAEPVQAQKFSRYIKVHLYREQVGERDLTRAYRESGLVHRRGVWVLLEAVTAEAVEFRSQAVATPANTIVLPELEQIAWRPVDRPEPLLYYYQAERQEPYPGYRTSRVIPASLTPLAYEAFGQIYDHGIFEGSEQPYDFTSENFRAAVEIWNGKRYQPHAYVRFASRE